MMNLGNGTDVIAFSSEAFGDDSVRTTSLLKEMANDRRVYFFEKPVLSASAGSTYYIEDANGVKIVRTYICAETSIFEQKRAQLELLKDLIVDEHISHYSMWTDTPVVMHFIRHLSPEVITYDCLKDYSKNHTELERELMQYADSVQTEGMKGPVTADPLRLLKTTKFKETYYSM